MDESDIIEQDLSEGEKKSGKKYWVMAFIIFVVGATAIYMITIANQSDNKLSPADIVIANETTFGEFICSNIRGVPTWISPDVGIVGEGFASFPNQKDAVDLLINARVFFFYDDNCAPCEEQIGYFGSEWGRYVSTGLTVNCNNL